ncbi:MAG: hypothetical protein AAF081_07975 [Actinomycetota bacterium]
MKTRVLSVIVLLTLLVTPVAYAQEQQELPGDVTDALGLDAAAIDVLEPNPAWNGLGLFSEDSLKIIEAATQERPFITYAFGDDPNGTPVFVPPGATPVGGGAIYWQLPEAWAAPVEGWGTDMAFAQTAGARLQPGDTFLLLWLEMDSDYDFSSPNQVNEGFPLTIPGLPVWNSTFAGDTWEGANLIPNAVYDAGVLTLDVKRYEPPQGFPLVDLASFYYRSGNLMAMGVSAEGLLALAESATDISAADGGQEQNLLFTGDAADLFAQEFGSALDDLLFEILVRGWTHITENGQFTPGYIFFLIDRYGALETRAALDALGLWFIDADALLDDGTAEVLEDEALDELDDIITEELLDGATAGTDDTPADEGADDATDTGGGSIGLLVGGAIAIVVAVVIAILFGRKRKEPEGDCADEKARWDGDEEIYRESIDAVAKAQQAAADATEARKEAGRAYTKAKAEVPPDGTDSVTDENTGETVTSLDRWLRDRYAADEWNRYQNDPTPETARAYEDAMREADTPEAREARRRDGERAAQAAEQARQRFEAAQEAERAAESALGRRQRDVDSARKIADGSKKAYEDCIKEQAEFDRKSAEAKKRYDEAMERERERSRDRTGGDDEPTGGPGGGPAVTTPPPAELGGDCWPPGSRERRPRAEDRFEVMSEDDTVTFTFFRSQGTWSSNELTKESGDPFMSQFGDAVSGTDERNAVFHLRSADAKRVEVGKLLQAWQARATWAEDTWFVTKTDAVDLTITWDYRKVAARCDNPFICSAQATWELEGPPVYSESSTSRHVESQTFTFGKTDPTADLNKLWSRLDKHITERDELYDFQLACNEGR